MSLIKLLKIPTKLFKKDAINFLKIRRHDLGVIDDKLRYIAVRPTASVLQIRQKLWYLLELPDYCDEILVLKTEQDEEIPLTRLRKGNDPQHPYILEVWLPGRQESTSRMEMVQMDESRTLTIEPPQTSTYDADETNDEHRDLNNKKPMYIKDMMAAKKKSAYVKNLMAEYTKSDLSCKISTSTLFFKMHGKKSKDNFAHLLLKIQSDLTTLTNKLSNLEDRIQL